MIFNDTYLIIKPQDTGDFNARVASINTQLAATCRQQAQSGKVLIWARVFLSDIINQLPIITDGELGQALDNVASSYVEQAPISGCQIAMLLCFSQDAKVDKIASDAKWITTPQGNLIYHTVRFAKEDIEGLDAKEQTIKAFEKHKSLLARYGMNVRDNTLRTWLFVRDIDHNYAEVVKGRNEFFAQNGLTKETHFVASTGIEGYSECAKAYVSIDFLSVENLNANEVKYLHATENLNATSDYGVAFERGTSVKNGNHSTSIISGTASIDKYGKCIFQHEPKQQTERLLLNIEALLHDGNSALESAKFLVVYLRDPADGPQIEEVIKKRLPNVPYVLTRAKVCRPEWLVEAECLA